MAQALQTFAAAEVDSNSEGANSFLLIDEPDHSESKDQHNGKNGNGPALFKVDWYTSPFAHAQVSEEVEDLAAEEERHP